MTQTGKTAINVVGKLNLPATGVATASAGFNSNPLDTQASAFSSGTHTAVTQDFGAAFGLGEDEKHISVVDSQGVALAGVQALYQLSLEKDKKIAQLSFRINRQAREAQTANRKIELLTRQCAELAKVSARLAAQQVELDRMMRVHQDAYAEASPFVVKH